MRDNWNELIIGEEINFLGGFPFSSSKFNDEGVGKPLIRIRDLLGSKQETFFSGEFSESYLIKEGDVLIGMDGDFHIVKWNNSPSLLNQRILKVSGKLNGKIDIDFLYYYLMPFLLEVHKKTAATTVKHLSTFDVSLASDHFPPLPQQRKIARILSTCDTVIAKTEEAIAKYQAIKQGMMHDLFTRGIDLNTGQLRPKYQDAPELYKESELGMIPKDWEVKRLEDIGEVISGGTPSSTIEEFWNGDILWVTPADLSKLKFGEVTNTERKITLKGLNSSSALMIPKNSIVISSRAPIGYCAIVKDDFTTNQGCKSINLNAENISKFYYYNIIQHVSRIKLKGEGTTFAEISKKELEKIKLTQPKKTEQKEISFRLEAIDKKLKIEISNLKKNNQIKSGLMQDLLSGKVEVSVSKDEEIA